MCTRVKWFEKEEMSERPTSSPNFLDHLNKAGCQTQMQQLNHARNAKRLLLDLQIEIISIKDSSVRLSLFESLCTVMYVMQESVRLAGNQSDGGNPPEER